MPAPHKGSIRASQAAAERRDGERSCRWGHASLAVSALSLSDPLCEAGASIKFRLSTIGIVSHKAGKGF